MKFRFALVAVCAGVLLSCGPVTSDPVGNNNNTAGPCSNGDTRCNGLSIETCQGGAWVLSITCLSPNPYCTETSFGPTCTPCQPDINVCQNGDVYSCTPEGQIGSLVQECTGDTECIGGTCTSPCLVAAQQKSYIGCDYWPTPTANLVDAAFDSNFGLVVHNAYDKVAHVVITLGSATVEERDVQPGTLETFTLSLDTGLKSVDVMGEIVTDSLKVTNGAYHLTSTMPVTVYQFNPLDYEIGANNSYSNDASLVLPTPTLSNNYIIMARQTFGVGDFLGFSFIPGFAAVVGTEDNTTVTVTLTSHTSAGTGITAGNPGTVQQFSLNQGEVLQLLSGVPGSCTGTQTSDAQADYCDQGVAYDLTGTLVETDKPVAVYSGHLCSFVPFDTWACDHLEEMMLPLETWGKDFVVGRTEPQEADPGDPDEPNVIRIVSGADSNVIRFTPDQPTVGGQTTLNKGQWVEFLATTDFHVNADYAIMVGQFLVGQNYYTEDLEYHGDPAYSLMVPTEQFRDSYTFLAPETITYNFVNVTKRVNEGGPTVMLDGAPIPDASFSQPIGTTGYGVARVSITGTHHTITSTEPFGIVVYGFATYTSYSYPGGLDLNYINPVD